MIFLSENYGPEFRRWTCPYGQLNSMTERMARARSGFALMAGSNIPSLDLFLFPFPGRFAASGPHLEIFNPP